MHNDAVTDRIALLCAAYAARDEVDDESAYAELELTYNWQQSLDDDSTGDN